MGEKEGKRRIPKEHDRPQKRDTHEDWARRESQGNTFASNYF